MATTATMPKTIYITTLPGGSNYVQCQPGSKIGSKRSFQIVSSTSPTPPVSTTISLVSPPPPSSKSPSPNLLAGHQLGGTNNVWLPATVQRTYKYETVDDDYDYDDSEDQDQSQYNDSDQPPRKRERLTHLSAEEKMFRRKMKNRIAAQTARDRKKALMGELEETVRRLEEENDTLAVENSKLRHDQSSLAQENERLKKMLAANNNNNGKKGSTTTTIKEDDVLAVSAFGPAESINDPLPKEQAKTGWALTWLVASALIQIYSECCAKSPQSDKVEKLRLQLEQLKESGSLTLENVLSRSPPEAIEKLREIIRSLKMTSTKPP